MRAFSKAVSNGRGSFPAIFVATSLLAVCCFSALGQVDCVEPATIKVSRIHGQVFDPSGVPIPGASVSFIQGSRIVSKVKTNSDGEFALAAANGAYEIRVTDQGFESLHFRLKLQREPRPTIRKKNVWVILGLPGGSCSWATTHRREFHYLISEFRKKTKD